MIASVVILGGFVVLIAFGYWQQAAQLKAIASTLEFARADNLKLRGDHNVLAREFASLKSDNSDTFALHTRVISEHEEKFARSNARADGVDAVLSRHGAWIIGGELATAKLAKRLDAPAIPAESQPIDVETSLQSSILDAALAPEH